MRDHQEMVNIWEGRCSGHYRAMALQIELFFAENYNDAKCEEKQ